MGITTTPSGGGFSGTITDTTSAGSGSLAGSALTVNQTWNTTGTPKAVAINVIETAANAASSLASINGGAAGATNYVTVLKGGNVGIGTTNPWGPLQVNKIGTGNLQDGLIIGSLNGGGTTVGLSLGTSAANVGYIQQYLYGTGWGNLALQSSGGNVGIGTTGPLGKLDVLTAPDATPSTLTAYDTRHVVFGPGIADGVAISKTAAGSGYITSLRPGVGWDPLAIQSSTFAFNPSGGTTALEILNNGNVGIGTTSPSWKLEVQNATATNDATYQISALCAGTDGTLGSLNIISELHPSATAGNRFASIYAGDSVSYRSLALQAYGGNVGIGTTSPTAVLHQKAGTAAANTAPQKLTTGVLLTTAEAGAIEFVADRFYKTITTGAVRTLDVQSVTGRSAGATAAVASVAAFTLGAADGSFEVSANVLVATSSAEAFTVTCAYTDEGNTARTMTLNFALLAGTIGTAINFANGAVPYEGLSAHIRCKASTTITIATTGTFTGATYNCEGVIKFIA